MLEFDEKQFKEKAKKYWTPVQLAKITNNKKYLVTPENAPVLLRILALLNADSSMSADSIRKFKQINHLLQLIEPLIQQLFKQFEGKTVIRVIDCGCGNSYLTFLLAWVSQQLWQIPLEIVGIDHRKDLIDKCTQKAQYLGLSDILHFKAMDIEAFRQERALIEAEQRKAERFHLVVALHACDTATDDALILALEEQADTLATAPCCQAELARAWKDLQAEQQAITPLLPMMKGAELRREGAALFTDMARVLLLRACGYEINTTEFVSAEHSPKNRLITGIKRGRYLKSAIVEYQALKKVILAPIKLEKHLTADIQDQLIDPLSIREK
jgi:SAM-dependent methyltransferase